MGIDAIDLVLAGGIVTFCHKDCGSLADIPWWGWLLWVLVACGAIASELNKDVP